MAATSKKVARKWKNCVFLPSGNPGKNFPGNFGGQKSGFFAFIAQEWKIPGKSRAEKKALFFEKKHVYFALFHFSGVLERFGRHLRARFVYPFPVARLHFFPRSRSLAWSVIRKVVCHKKWSIEDTFQGVCQGRSWDPGWPARSGWPASQIRLASQIPGSAQPDPRIRPARSGWPARSQDLASQIPGSSQDPARIDPGAILGRSWGDPGAILGRSWELAGQTLRAGWPARIWLARSWVRSWVRSGICQELAAAGSGI